MSDPQIVVDPSNAGISISDPDPTISVLWDQAVQAAVIAEKTGPTVASRAYAITHTATFEAWAAYDPTAVGTAWGDCLQVESASITDANKTEAMSYAAYVALVDLFPEQTAIFDALMADLGYSVDLANVDSAPAVLGMTAGQGVVDAFADDGSNQAVGYQDTTGYVPTNSAPGDLVDIAKWTPQYVPIDTGGPESLQTWLTPHWGAVSSFALPGNDALRPPAPEPFFQPAWDATLDPGAGTITIHGLGDDATKDDLKALKTFLKKEYEGDLDKKEVKTFLKSLSEELKDREKEARDQKKADKDKGKEDGKGHDAKQDAPKHDKHGETDDAADAPSLTLDVSKDLIGTIINPGFVAQAESIIAASANLTTEDKVIAEFWEDGGGTSFPPGTWMSFAEYVSARDDNSLDADAQLFFMMGNAVCDAGIATWDAKIYYDYARPVSVIRDLGTLGLIGEWGTDYLGNEGYVVDAYAGTGLGTQSILVTDFITYQNPYADPSPPFAEYTSGHSAFSAAGATILSLFTGSDAFGAEIEIDFLIFEGIADLEQSVILSWETFDDAAYGAGMSRIYGGIHFDQGNVQGTVLGTEVGHLVFDEAMTYITGTAEHFDFV